MGAILMSVPREPENYKNEKIISTIGDKTRKIRKISHEKTGMPDGSCGNRIRVGIAVPSYAPATQSRSRGTVEPFAFGNPACIRGIA